MPDRIQSPPVRVQSPQGQPVAAQTSNNLPQIQGALFPNPTGPVGQQGNAGNGNKNPQVVQPSPPPQQMQNKNAGTAPQSSGVYQAPQTLGGIGQQQSSQMQPQKNASAVPQSGGFGASGQPNTNPFLLPGMGSPMGTPFAFGAGVNSNAYGGAGGNPWLTGLGNPAGGYGSVGGMGSPGLSGGYGGAQTYGMPGFFNNGGSPAGPMGSPMTGANAASIWQNPLTRIAVNTVLGPAVGTAVSMATGHGNFGDRLLQSQGRNSGEDGGNFSDFLRRAVGKNPPTQPQTTPTAAP